MASERVPNLLKSKTIWTGISAILGALGAYYTDGLPVGEAINLAVTGLIGIFLRQGIEKQP